MSAEDIEICCNACNASTGTSKNEWVQWDASHIWPLQKPWYTATRIKEDRNSFPYTPDKYDLFNIVVSYASCSLCGAMLGGYCRSARGVDAPSFKYVV